MKLLYLISHLAADGPVHALLAIVRGLRQLGGNDVTVLTLSNASDDLLAPEFERQGVLVRNLPFRFGRAFSDVLRLRHFIREGGFDIAAATCVRADVLLVLATAGLKAPKRFTTVQNVPAEDLGYLYPGWRGRWAARLHYAALRRFGTRTICVSETIRQHLIDQQSIRGTVVLNPVSLPDGYTVAPSATSTLTRTVVYAASVSERKNTSEALAYFNQSRDLHACDLDVYGKGPLEAELRSRYAQTPYIRWCGFSDRLHEALTSAQLYISASRSEGLPLTPQIALMCGCPCLLSDIPQHRELAQLSPYVFLYRCGDLDDYRRALSDALAVDRRAAITAGRQLADKISPVSTARQLLALYAHA